MVDPGPEVLSRAAVDPRAERNSFVTPDGCTYIVHRPGGLEPIRIERVAPDGSSRWLPMRLTWISRLKCAVLTQWPPETLDRLELVNGRVAIEYRDPWYEDEKTILPFDLDKESLWRATFDPTRERWSLTRIRTLDYGGKDSPP